MAIYNNSLDETIGIVENSTVYLAITLSDTFGFAEGTASDAVFHLLETVGVSDVLDETIKGYQSVADGVKLSDVFAFVIDLVASDTIGVQDSAAINRQNAVAILDSVVLAGIATTRIKAYNSLTALIGLLEYVNKGLAANILETVGLTEDTLSSIGLVSAILDTVGLSETTTDVVGIYTEVSESMAVSDEILTTAILQNLLNDGAIVSTTILGPGTAVYTGWIMNSENFAVSNYGNYKFTDMALLNGSYFGVMDDGVYLLEGNTDDGANIGARLATAAMEFGTSNLKTITQMYMGLRGDGDLVIKMVSDEDEDTWYQGTVIDTTLRTERLTGAKGQVGRYWQLKLVSTDSTKLDLDAIELFPIVWGRKL
jgi:hypothetical protein